MSTLLYRVGKTAFSKPAYFIIGWVLILGIVISMISINGIHISSEMKIEGTESQKVLDQLAKELPAASGGQGSVVFKAPDNERLDTPERLAAMMKGVNEVYGLDKVINPADYAAEAGNSGAQAEMAQNAQATDMAQSATTTPPPYGPLMVDGVPVPGMLISSDGSIALFQFQFTIEQSAITQDVFDSVIQSVMTVEQGTNITGIAGRNAQNGIDWSRLGRDCRTGHCCHCIADHPWLRRCSRSASDHCTPRCCHWSWWCVLDLQIH